MTVSSWLVCSDIPLDPLPLNICLPPPPALRTVPSESYKSWLEDSGEREDIKKLLKSEKWRKRSDWDNPEKKRVLTILGFNFFFNLLKNLLLKNEEYEDLLYKICLYSILMYSTFLLYKVSFLSYTDCLFPFTGGGYDYVGL